jgi:hypothetical protein
MKIHLSKLQYLQFTALDGLISLLDNFSKLFLDKDLNDVEMQSLLDSLRYKIEYINNIKEDDFFVEDLENLYFNRTKFYEYSKKWHLLNELKNVLFKDISLNLLTMHVIFLYNAGFKKNKETEEFKEMKLGDSIKFFNAIYQVDFNKSTKHYFLINESNNRQNSQMFDQLGIDKFDFQEKILGYRTRGGFPECKTISELNKFVKALYKKYYEYKNQ